MSTSNVEIRPATVEDAAGIAQVHVASWRFAYRDVFPPAFLDSLSVDGRTVFWENGVAHQLPRAIILVAAQGDQVIGFCSCGPVLSAKAPESLGEVGATYVDPASARQGEGRRLMDAALDHLAREGFTEAILWVLKDNPIGRTFYEGYGWTPSGVVRRETIGGVVVTELQYRIDVSAT